MEKEYLIRKRPAAALLIFALPMMLGNFFQQVYTMADSAIVGRLVGEDALAAVGASYSLTNVFISIAIGGGVGASAVSYTPLDVYKRQIHDRLKSVLGLETKVTLVSPKSLERFQGKAKRVLDLRNQPEE